MTIGLYGDRKWGNCQRVAWTFEYPGISYRWADVDILKGETRSAECLGIHSAVQLPVIILSDGRPLAQSNAIMTCLAEGTDLSPPDRYARACMYAWLYCEEYNREPYIASVRPYGVD